MEKRQWTSIVKLTAAVLLTFPLLTGCWDRLEIEDRAMVLGISVDSADIKDANTEDQISHLRGKFPAPNKNMIRVAVQIALPGKIPLGPGESGAVGKGAEETVWVISVVGHTIDDAIMNLQQQISSRLFFGHLRIIVVSEKVAKLGLQNLNDYFRRNPEVRRTAWMAVSKGDAEPMMRAAPKLERVPTLYLLSTLDEAVKQGKFPNDFLGIFWSNSSKKGQEAFLPYIELTGSQSVELKGMAYFKNDKMLDKSEPFEIAAYMGIKGLNPAGYRAFINLDSDPAKTVTIFATHRQSKIDVKIRNGRPFFSISVYTETNLEEKLSESLAANNSELLQRIEEENKKSLIKAYQGLIKKTQNKGSDIFGFGEYVRAKEPVFWNREIQTKEKWQQMYPEVQMEIKVYSKVRRVGMKAR
ncbi:Ger(x)C family spore germination protein [Paenibacillus doosanensis]|uniref:Ger(x)C family spore germination protein n=1 Tax=Paenibacillus doosanensis TaxID=1229154 RepID=UPI00217FBC4C|nr:Ger(x)C family spore germination protein [Paenibacillus doosanensis]MCS7458770.1 Ger(x)C family spore germination protein [Paenibacillus doosanensis]